MLKVVEYRDGNIQIEDERGFVHALAVMDGEELIVLDPRLDPNITEDVLEFLELDPLSPTEVALRLCRQGIKASVGWPY